MGKMKKTLTAALAVIMTVCCFTACGDKDAALKKGKTQITFWAAVSPSNKELIIELKDNYNKTNEDMVYVNLDPKSSGYSAQLSTSLMGRNVPDIVMVDDRYFKGNVIDGLFTDLTDYMADSTIDLSDVWQSPIDRFRFNPETGYSGGDNPLYAVPSDNQPTLIYYNLEVFDEQKINIVSIGEDELTAYNEENGTSYLPHGYYAYAASPAEGLSVRKDGLYHVFNNRIPMNWEELVALSEIFTKEFNASSSSKFGFLNEWWFSYGWSVGGDCLEWVSDPNGDGDESDGQYKFSLGEKTPNYLVTGEDAVTIDGTSYAAGELLSYDDKHYVESHKTETEIAGYLASERLYEMPSVYDAFLEFCRLSQTTGKDVAQGVKGYGISPDPNTLNQKGKNLYFSTGEVAMLCNGLGDAYNIGQNMNGAGKRWDVAPLYQYREYNDDGSLKTVNGTEIKGKMSAHSTATGYAIPSNSKNKAAAWKFIEYLMGEDAQRILAKSAINVPILKSVAASDVYMKETAGFAPKNKAIVVEAAEYATVGDWSYVEDGEWILGWSNELNGPVRNGTMTLEQFFLSPAVLKTDESLKKYTARKFNG